MIIAFKDQSKNNYKVSEQKSSYTKKLCLFPVYDNHFALIFFFVTVSLIWSIHCRKQWLISSRGLVWHLRVAPFSTRFSSYTRVMSRRPGHSLKGPEPITTQTNHMLVFDPYILTSTYSVITTINDDSQIENNWIHKDWINNFFTYSV